LRPVAVDWSVVTPPPSDAPIEVPVFNDVFTGDGYVFDTVDVTFYDNIFDEEPFPDPVIDAALDSDRAAVKSAKSVCAVHDQETDDLADGLVFDTNPVDLEDGLVFDVELVHDRVDVELDDDPLFDEDHEYEEAKLGQDFVIGYNIAATPTTVDAPFTCSTECPHVVFNTDLTLVTLFPGNGPSCSRSARTARSARARSLTSKSGSCAPLTSVSSSTPCSLIGSVGSWSRTAAEQKLEWQ
jgi:hypothetical protein